MAHDSIFTGGIRQFNHIDTVLTDRSFYFGRRVWIVDHNEVLDVLVVLIRYTLDCLEDAGITSRGGNNRYKGVLLTIRTILTHAGSQPPLEMTATYSEHILVSTQEEFSLRSTVVRFLLNQR